MELERICLCGENEVSPVGLGNTIQEECLFQYTVAYIKVWPMIEKVQDNKNWQCMQCIMPQYCVILYSKSVYHSSVGI